MISNPNAKGDSDIDIDDAQSTCQGSHLRSRARDLVFERDGDSERRTVACCVNLARALNRLGVRVTVEQMDLALKETVSSLLSTRVLVNDSRNLIFAQQPWEIEEPKMGWNKGNAWFSDTCHECGKKVEKGETCYIEVKGIFPQPKAICEECFKKNHPEAKVESQAKTFLKRITFRTE